MNIQQSLTNTFLKNALPKGLLAPVETLPFTNFQYSGMGVVPKKEGKWKVINHLSVPFGGSVNDIINPKEFRFATPQ